MPAPHSVIHITGPVCTSIVLRPPTHLGADRRVTITRCRCQVKHGRTGQSNKILISAVYIPPLPCAPLCVLDVIARSYLKAWEGDAATARKMWQATVKCELLGDVLLWHSSVQGGPGPCSIAKCVKCVRSFVFRCTVQSNVICCSWNWGCGRRFPPPPPLPQLLLPRPSKDYLKPHVFSTS